jgi:ATP-dependent Lhr-like helicase
VARAHHGSVSRQERSQIEEALKAGRLPAVVATSSLELGIDMGAVDLVIQVEAPPSVASGLQRTGRAGHNVGDISRGLIFPKYQGDLVQATVVARRMLDGAIEELRMPRNPLDVLAQQIVAMTAMDDWEIATLEQTVRRAAPFASLTRPVLEAVLDMLAGRYPSEEFAGLRARVVWDRTTGMLHGRPGAQRLAVTNGGTIPDRGLFGVFLAGGQRDSSGRHSRRVGELDEEMVYESWVGDVFVLGASSWRIEDITADQVLVSPAPGQPGRLPFWHGDAPGRQAELGRAIGEYCRELGAASEQVATDQLRRDGLDELAAANLISYLAAQRAATGYLPDDKTLVMERFRDELGDWRLVLHSPYGARVHAPWALAIAARLRERYQGMDVQALHTDDGIVIRVPDADDPPPAGIAALEPDEVEQLVTAELGSSALFASRFRECAARALLLPRRQPGRRTPLWQLRGGCGWWKWRRPRRPRSGARCCSGTWARSCTRATRRWPSAGPRRWRWTRRCSPSCSGRPMLENCWTRTSLARRNATRSASPRTAGAVAWRRWLTCSRRWARCRPWKSRSGARNPALLPGGSPSWPGSGG